MSDDPTSQLWAQAVEEHIAGMPEADFNALIDRTRAHTAATQNPLASRNLADPADRQRAVLASIQDKQLRLNPKREDVDHNGYRTDR